MAFCRRSAWVLASAIKPDQAKCLAYYRADAATSPPLGPTPWNVGRVMRGIDLSAQLAGVPKFELTDVSLAQRARQHGVQYKRVPE